MKPKALLFVSLLALIACSAAPAGVPGPRAVPDAQPGGTITVGTGPLSSLDPQLATDPDTQLVIRTMCDQLIEFDPNTSRPVGGLAESWTITSDGRRLIVKLRKDLRFSDGTEVTVDDVIYTLTRLASEDLGSPAARLLEDVSGFGFVHGDLDTDEDRLIRELAGVRRIEGRSFEVALDEPNAEFFKALSHPATSIVSRESATKRRSLVCAGPYRLRDDPPEGRVVLERSPTRGGLTAAHTKGGAGYADQIVFVVFNERSGALDAYMAGGEIDAVPVAGERRAEVSASPDRFDVTTAQLEMIGLPTGKPPFDDPDVRRALSLALDRERITAEVFGSDRQPAMGFVGPEVAGASGCVDDGKVNGDVDGARRLLSDAGVDLSTTTARIYFNDEFANAKLVAEVAEQWRAGLGLTSELVAMGWEEFLANGTGLRGFDGPFRYAWLPEYPSVDRVLHPLFDTDSIGRDNLSRHSSRDLRASLRAARRAIDDGAREQAYRRAQKVICDESPAIPLVFDIKSFLIRSSRVGSAVGGPVDKVWAEPNLRDWYVRQGS